MIAMKNEELHACFRCLGPVSSRGQRGRPRRCPLSAARTSCNSTPRFFLRVRRCWWWSTRAKLWANLLSPLQQPRPCSSFRIPCETQTLTVAFQVAWLLPSKRIRMTPLPVTSPQRRTLKCIYCVDFEQIWGVSTPMCGLNKTEVEWCKSFWGASNSFKPHSN